MVLTKWYLDAVADDGRVVIGYLSEIRIGPIRLRPGSILLRTREGEVKQRTILRGAGRVKCEEDRLSWSCRRFGINGMWTRRAAPIERTLLERSDGVIRWDCIQPAGVVGMNLHGCSWRGSGYVERLRVSIPVRRLPIHQLRWGRFVGQRTSIVWIEWQGSEPRLLVFRDGMQAASASVTDDVVRINDDRLAYELLLDRAFTLRDGIIGKSALRGLELLKPLLPKLLRDGHETKWLSRCVLRTAESEVDRGWSIHEWTRFGAAPQ